MGMNDTPGGERVCIGFFGCRNAGKSSLANAVTGQRLSVVSDVRGTTTDPVRKAMELLPLGPVTIVDTPGFDDEGALGELRVQRAREILAATDIAVLVVDGGVGMTDADAALLALIDARRVPRLIAWNKADLATLPPPDGALPVSAATGAGVGAFKEALARLKPGGAGRRLVADLIQPGDAAVLVCPIDESAPKGRLILPQQQVIRDLLEAGALPLVTRETELDRALSKLASPPALVITDSQAFKIVDAIVPREVPLTSFSILMARYKGFLDAAVAGVGAIDALGDGDRVLLAEGCTHHRQCNDIGTVKIPRWLRGYTGKAIEIETVSGRDFPDDLSGVKLVIHCGGCMLTERDVQRRMESALAQGVPFTNYGTVIARMTGALERSLRPFPELLAILAGGGA